MGKQAQEFERNVIDVAFEKLSSNLPAVFARGAVPTLLGGAISAGTLANLGRDGPPSFLLNGHIVYERDTFIHWLRSRAKPVKP